MPPEDCLSDMLLHVWVFVSYRSTYEGSLWRKDVFNRSSCVFQDIFSYHLVEIQGVPKKLCHACVAAV